MNTARTTQLLISFLFFVKFSQSKCDPPVAVAFYESGLVPDILDQPPCMGMKVRYGQREVFLGNKFTPEEIFNHPDFVNWRAWDNSYYLYVMLDPDVPSRANPIFREVLHNLIGNINGSNISTGKEYYAYLPGLPSNNTGYHRYTFLVYQQPGYIDYNLTYIPGDVSRGRFNFSIRNFTMDHGLGEPLAGNFLNAAFDEFVSVKNANHTYY